MASNVQALGFLVCIGDFTLEGEGEYMHYTREQIEKAHDHALKIAVAEANDKTRDIIISASKWIVDAEPGQVFRPNEQSAIVCFLITPSRLAN